MSQELRGNIKVWYEIGDTKDGKRETIWHASSILEIVLHGEGKDCDTAVSKVMRQLDIVHDKFHVSKIS